MCNEGYSPLRFNVTSLVLTGIGDNPCSPAFSRPVPPEMTSAVLGLIVSMVNDGPQQDTNNVNDDGRLLLNVEFVEKVGEECRDEDVTPPVAVFVPILLLVAFSHLVIVVVSVVMVVSVVSQLVFMVTDCITVVMGKGGLVVNGLEVFDPLDGVW